MDIHNKVLQSYLRKAVIRQQSLAVLLEESCDQILTYFGLISYLNFLQSASNHFFWYFVFSI